LPNNAVLALFLNNVPRSTHWLESALADAAALVQYCINTCSAVDAVQRTIPLPPGAQVAGERQIEFLEEKAGQSETSIRWPDRFEGK
jgi:hypothetical protein